MHQTDMAKEMALEHPSVWILLGSIDQEILGMAEKCMGEYVLAPSEPPPVRKGIHGRGTSGAEPTYC